VSAGPVRASQNEIEASAASVTPVRAANRGNVTSMTGGRQPVVDRSPDRPAPDRRLARALVAGDQEDDPIAAPHRSLQLTVDRAPGAVEGHSVEVDDPIGLDVAARKALVPASVERSAKAAARLRRSRCVARPSWDIDGLLRTWLSCFRKIFVAGQGSDRGRDARPQRRFLRAERAHGPPRPSAAGQRRRRCPTFRRRSGSRRVHCPRRCRTGSAP